MKWLSAFLSDVLGKITKALLDSFVYLGTRIVTAMTAVLGLLLTPLNYLIDWMSGLLEGLATQLSGVASLIGDMHFGDVQGYWNALSPYFGLLDLFIPLGLLTGTIASTCVLWALVLVIRIVIRLIPTAG